MSLSSNNDPYGDTAEDVAGALTRRPRTDTTNRHQAENIIGALLAYPQLHPTSNTPNPIVGTFPYAGGIIRVYYNGMLDAIDGPTYSVSPGWSRDHSTQMLDWLDKQAMSVNPA